MSIRLAQPHDLSAVIDITRRAYAQYRPLLSGDPVPVDEDYAPRIASGQVWLLEIEGAPAGLVVLDNYADRLHIFSVAVAPNRQHRGLGQRLLTFAEDVARERGFPLIDLCTNWKMERNIRLYREWGFVERGRRPNPKRPGWIIVDMEKRLTEAAERKKAV
jgi:ribosomal protein S18 acetylase RimI-like enzyme